MNSQAREVVAIAESLGFTFDGYDGSGHVVLSLPDGQRISIPATPSEYRGRKNAIAQLERMSGRKIPRPNHRRGRMKRETEDPQIEASRRRHSDAFQAKADERDAARLAELARQESARRAAAADRRRREIEELMR